MISVVIPLYNKVHHVQRAIRSVLAQTCGDFEVIIVDDGSNDGSGDAARTISDPRIRLIAQENAGVSAARNRGIREARGNLIAFLDADDEWRPGFLETVLGLRERHPECGLYATAYRHQSDRQAWRPPFRNCPSAPAGGIMADYFLAGLDSTPVWTSAVAVPYDILLQTGGFKLGLRRGEDLQLWARIALRYPVAWSPQEGAIYHVSSENRSDKVALNPDVGVAAAIEEFFAAGGNPVSNRRYVEEYLVTLRLTHATACWLQGRRAWALDLLAKTKGTVLFRMRRRRLQAMVWCPPTLARWFLAAMKH